ncbi:MAG: B12-binding domain-containing radical SAM protein [Promethearchaeota archaeon]
MSKNNKNLLFIIPGFFYIEDYQKLLYFNDIPLGTLQLSSLLKERKKIKTNIIDMRVEGEKNVKLAKNDFNEDRFKDAFLKVLELNNIQEYQNIGINCYTSYQFLYTDSIAKILKDEFPNVNIIVGGYHPTGVPDDFIYKNSPYDYIIRGEAESVLLQLLNSNRTNQINSVSKTKVLNSNNLIDVNTLPFPDYELYLEQYPYKNKFKFEFYNSRGCPYQCAFCGENYYFRNFNFDKFKENFKKLSKIVEEYNPNILKIGFADQSFNRIAINEKILDYLLKNELQDKFTFSCQSRIETVFRNLELIDKFRKCKMIVGYGFETANKNLLKEMHKTKNSKQYLEDTIKILKNYKDNNETYCRLNILVGFPGETQQSFYETVNFVKKFALHGNIQISPTLFSNYPNVFVYDNMEYYERKYGSKFVREWWKLPSNPFKNAVPQKPSKKYSLKQIIGDYKDKYVKILKIFKRNTFAELVSWKNFFNKWYKQL